MRSLISTIVTGVLSALVANAAHGSPVDADALPSVTAAEDSGIPPGTLIRAVSRKTGKRFIIDSKVHGKVEIIGEDIGAVTYGELLSILQMEGFAVVEGGGVLRVIPEAIVRQMTLPLFAVTAAYPDAQYASAIIPVHKVPAATLVPVLRPLLPQQAHLAAAVCSNAIPLPAILEGVCPTVPKPALRRPQFR